MASGFITHGGPAANAAEVTPDDEADLASPTRALWVGGEGDLHVTMLGGQDATFTGLTVGWHPLCVVRVHEDSTATDIVAVW